jgi:hypothetical protein
MYTSSLPRLRLTPLDRPKALSHLPSPLDTSLIVRVPTNPVAFLYQGTTFSGVAFAFATNNEAKEDIITEWPGAGSYTKQKVGEWAV